MASCTTPKCTRLLLTCFGFPRVGLHRKWNIPAIFGLELSNALFSALKTLKGVYSTLRGYFQQTKRCKPTVNLWVLERWMLRCALFLRPLVHYLYCQDPACYVYRLESPSFSPCYFGKKWVSLWNPFPNNDTLWNSLPRGCFFEYYNLNLFRFGFTRYLSAISL